MFFCCSVACKGGSKGIWLSAPCTMHVATDQACTGNPERKTVTRSCPFLWNTWTPGYKTYRAPVHTGSENGILNRKGRTELQSENESLQNYSWQSNCVHPKPFQWTDLKHSHSYICKSGAMQRIAGTRSYICNITEFMQSSLRMTLSGYNIKWVESSWRLSSACFDEWFY